MLISGVARVNVIRCGPLKCHSTPPHSTSPPPFLFLPVPFRPVARFFLRGFCPSLPLSPLPSPSSPPALSPLTRSINDSIDTLLWQSQRFLFWGSSHLVNIEQGNKTYGQTTKMQPTWCSQRCVNFGTKMDFMYCIGLLVWMCYSSVLLFTTAVFGLKCYRYSFIKLFLHVLLNIDAKIPLQLFT